MKTKASIFFIFLLASSLLVSCGAKPPVKEDIVTLKISMVPQMSQAAIFIAEAEGYFAEYGIQLESISITPSSKAVPLLVSGDVDIFAGSMQAGFLNTVYLDDTIRAVADRGHIAPGNCTYQAIAIRRDLFESGEVTGPADLEGLKFSTSPGGPGHYLLSTYMGQAGLTDEDIEITDIRTADEIVAYANKSLDGSTPGEPSITQLLEAGDAVVLARSEEVVGKFQIAIVAFNKRLLVDQRDVGARFLAAYLKGAQQYNEGKTERNLQILSEATGQPVEDLKKMCWVAINGDGMIDFAGVDGFQQWSIDYGYLDNPVTEEQFWDPGMLSAAEELLNP